MLMGCFPGSRLRGAAAGEGSGGKGYSKKSGGNQLQPNHRLSSLPRKADKTHQSFGALRGTGLFTFNSPLSSILCFTHQDLHSIGCCLLLSQFLAPCFCWWEATPIDHCLELKPWKENPKEVNPGAEVSSQSKHSCSWDSGEKEQLLLAGRANPHCHMQKTQIPRVSQQLCLVPWHLQSCSGQKSSSSSCSEGTGCTALFPSPRNTSWDVASPAQG